VRRALISLDRGETGLRSKAFSSCGDVKEFCYHQSYLLMQKRVKGIVIS
jgi:hypothetical protein